MATTFSCSALKAASAAQRCNNFKQITSQGFLCNVFNVHRIPYDYCFIDIMGLIFFNDKFFDKINVFKSKGALHSSEQIRLRK